MSEQTETETDATDPSTQFKDQMVGVYHGDIETGINLPNQGEMALDNLNLTATYTLRAFDRIWEETKQELDELPDWAENENEAQHKRNLATHIVKQVVSDKFGISTGGLSVETGVSVRNDDYKVTIVY